MPRIQPINQTSADIQAAEILSTVKQKMGIVPNLISTMAQSPAVAKAYLEFSGALGGGTLTPRLREQLSLVVGQENSCSYCVSAHSVLGKKAGLTEEDVLNARQGVSNDSKESAALQFAQKVVRERANVSDSDVDNLRNVNFTDGEISEIIANIALNMFTNYFNEIAGTEIDFQVAPDLTTA